MKNVAKSITKKAIATLLTLVLVLGALPFTAPLTVQANPMPTPPTPTTTITAPGTVAPNTVARVAADINGNITVGANAVLILDGNFTITGTVNVQNGGSFFMSNGTITGTGGRGVSVTGSDSEFIMSGTALIYNNAAILGGGVLVEHGATFTMINGIIKNNTANENGGGVNVSGSGSAFTMTGGTIRNNVASSFGGGVAVDSGAVFNMSGVAHIYTNTAYRGAGVNATNTAMQIIDGNTEVIPTFMMTGGLIENNHSTLGSYPDAGGVRIISNARFDMYGGVIQNNQVANARTPGTPPIGRAGGVLVAGESTFNFSGGAIRNNASHGDGGIRLINSSVLNMTHPAIIYGNLSAGTAGGGGVGLHLGSVFNMSSGTIDNNRGINGGGVWLASTSGRFYATAGSITNNHATQFGGGIWTVNYTNLDISNSVTFRNNTAGAGRFDHGVNHSGDTPCPHCPNLPANASGATGGSIANINWARVSLWGSHALNNYDINYHGAPWVPPTYLTPEIDIEKTFRLPTGSLLPTPPSRTTIDFEFEVNLVEVNGFSPPQFRLPGQPAGAYQHLIFEPEISFNPGTTLSTGSGYVYATGTHIVCFANITWPFPGMFVFEVRELANTSGLSGLGTMVYDPARFRIYVHTRWLDDEQQHVGVWYYYARVPFVNCAACEAPANGNNGGNGTTPAPCTCTGCATGNFCAACRRRVKGNEIPFNNRFAPNGSLVVEKAVTGTSQLNTEFEFGMVLTLPPLMAGHHPTSITAYIYGYTRQNGQPVEDQPKVRIGNAITVSVVVTEGVTTATLPTFHLRHGDEIRFASLPIGTTYVVTEANQDRYTQTARVTIGGTTGNVIEQIGTAALTIPGSVAQRMYNEAIDSASNRVVVTNDRVHAPPMAAMFNDAPFGLMLAIGAGALGLVGTVAIAYKKKKR